MLTRRDLLRGLGVLVLGDIACNRGHSSRPTRPTWPRKTTYEGIEMIELFPGDADERSPLIVAIHGMGDRPEHWVEDWRRFPAKVHIALPRAFDPYGPGFSWFQFEDGMTDEQLGAAVGTAEARLWKGIAKLAGDRRV